MKDTFLTGDDRGGLDPGYTFGRAWLDVNGDGKADYLRFVGDRDYSRLRISFSNGAGFGGFQDIKLNDLK